LDRYYNIKNKEEKLSKLAYWPKVGADGGMKDQLLNIHHVATIERNNPTITITPT
jgi:hypothetical protein